MPEWDETTLTERQRKWFASVRAGLERDTGRSLDDWAEIARLCPETRHRARLTWMKTRHGLAQNRASLVLDVAFPPTSTAGDPQTPDDPLWREAAARAIFQAVERAALSLPHVLVGRRKGYTAFSRKLQFAAVRPERGGVCLLGLATPPELSVRLAVPVRRPWSERLKSIVVLDGPGAVDAEITALMHEAWMRS